MQGLWEKAEFQVDEHRTGPRGERTTYKLKELKAVIDELDESLSIISDIQGSRYVKRLQKEVEKEHETLLMISDTIE